MDAAECFRDAGGGYPRCRGSDGVPPRPAAVPTALGNRRVGRVKHLGEAHHVHPSTPLHTFKNTAHGSRGPRRLIAHQVAAIPATCRSGSLNGYFTLATFRSQSTAVVDALLHLWPRGG